MHGLHGWFRNPVVWRAARFNVYTISLAALWTPLGTVLLQQRVSDLTSPGSRDSALGVITFAGITVAAITQPIAGRLSDQAPFPDRRRPFILAGTALDLVFLALFWWAPGFFWLFGAYLLLQLSSNLAQAAFQALIPDLMRPEERGMASGVKNGYDLLGSVVGLAGVGVLLGAGLGAEGALLFIGALLAVGAFLSVWWVPPVPPLPSDARSEMTRRPMSPWTLLEAFRLDVRRHSLFALTMTSRFLFLLGMYPAQRFLLYFLELRYSLAQTGVVALFLLGLVLLGAVAAVASGVLSDRFGRLGSLRMGVVLGAAGLVGVAFTPSLQLLLIPGALLAVGVGTFQAVSWALLADLIPRGQEARFYGLSNLATAGASAFAGLFGPLISWLAGLGAADPYQVAFLVAATVALGGLAPLQWFQPDRRDPAAS